MPALDINVKAINETFRKYIRYAWSGNRDDIYVGNIPIQIFYGGAASSKSYSIIGQRTPLDMFDRNRNFMLVREVARTNKVSTFNEVIKGINRLPREISRTFKINRSDGIITGPLGNQIRTFGLDDPEKLKSATPEQGVWTDAIIEEATETKEPAFEQILKRLRGNFKTSYNGFNKRVVFLFNPIYKTHWIYKRFFEGRFSDNDTEYLDDNLLIRKTTYRDNIKNLTEDDIQRILGDKDDYYRQVYAYGNWGVLGNIIFDNWEIADLRGIEDEKRFDKYYNGLDFGFSNDPDAFERMAVTKEAIYFLDEIYASGLNTTELAGLIRSKIGNEIVRCDSEDPRMINELRLKKVNAIAAKKGPGSVEHGIRWLRSKKCIIHKGNRGLISEWTSGTWKEDKFGNALPEISDDFRKRKHGTDASRYGLEPEIGNFKARAY